MGWCTIRYVPWINFVWDWSPGPCFGDVVSSIFPSFLSIIIFPGPIREWRGFVWCLTNKFPASQKIFKGQRWGKLWNKNVAKEIEIAICQSLYSTHYHLRNNPDSLRHACAHRRDSISWSPEREAGDFTPEPLHQQPLITVGSTWNICSHIIHWALSYSK